MVDTPWQLAQREKLERLKGAQDAGQAPKPRKKRAKKKTGASTTG
jgi:hypothetical protein